MLYARHQAPAPIRKAAEVIACYKQAYAEAFAVEVAKLGKGGMLLGETDATARTQYAQLPSELIEKAALLVKQQYRTETHMTLRHPLAAGMTGALRCNNEYYGRNHLDLLVSRSDEYLRGKLTVREFIHLTETDIARVTEFKPEHAHNRQPGNKQFHAEMLLNAALFLPVAMQQANPAHYPKAVKNPAVEYQSGRIR